MKKFLSSFVLIFLFVISIGVVGCGHSHAYSTTVINPTKTTNGYTRHSCECGEFYDDTYTCLISFESTSQGNSVSPSSLPQIASKIVALGSVFEKIDNTNDYKIVNYVNLTPNQTVLNSTTVTLVWQAYTQAEKDCLNIVAKFEKLLELSKNYSSENVLLRATQYIRTAKYTTNAWNIVGGNIDENFITYVTQNQGNINVASLRETATLTSPVSNELIDFIHMFAVINGIENTSSINSGSADLAGWVGDLCTLVQEIVNAGATGSQIQELANQKFNSNTSTFGSQDLVADLDAVNIMQNYYNSTNKTFSQLLTDYYFSTSKAERKTQFIQNVFGKTYSNASQMVTDIMTRLKNNFLITYFCNTLGINLTTHEAQFIACATAFANYFFEN